MRNLFLIFVHFTTAICIAQNTNPDSDKQFTISQIDSICTNDIDSRIYISDGKTGGEIKIESSKKTEIIKGSGGFSYLIYAFHFNQDYYNTLTRKEQNKYNFRQNSTLIKGIYHWGIGYENFYGEEITGEFYYFKDALFHVKIKLVKTENKKDNTQILDLNIAELNDSKTIKNILLMDMKS
ncbi:MULTISPECIES: hypothetical protein [Flavobacterium]|uniref:hypothetical protein n=1 Tax=Flavobacterium TaxID=237 RepID=UPI0021150A9C|nr:MULTISPECIES: hypothetical protein [Flavobacterium]UUF12699.1 hypothetical protein NLJ00_15690 [Flavobacterium panici]